MIPWIPSVERPNRYGTWRLILRPFSSWDNYSRIHYSKKTRDDLIQATWARDIQPPYWIQPHCPQRIWLTKLSLASSWKKYSSNAGEAFVMIRVMPRWKCADWKFFFFFRNRNSDPVSEWPTISATETPTRISKLLVTSPSGDSLHMTIFFYFWKNFMRWYYNFLVAFNSFMYSVRIPEWLSTRDYPNCHDMSQSKKGLISSSAQHPKVSTSGLFLQ